VVLIIFKEVSLNKSLSPDIDDGGERVSPDMPDDVFLAHLSIYHFAASYVEGLVVLDAGCGTGYGSHYLVETGRAACVEAIDINSKAIEYCESRYARENLRFHVCDLAHVSDPQKRFDFIFSSNVLEHLYDLESALARLSNLLRQDGKLLIAVPPCVSPLHLQSNFNNPYHLNNYHPLQWYAKISRFFHEVVVYRHGVKEGVRLDFSPTGNHSQLEPTDFTFTVFPVERLANDFVDTLTLVMIAERPRLIPGPVKQTELEFPLNCDIDAIWRTAEPERRRVYEAIGRAADYNDARLRSRIYPIRDY
jgi:SAM-dependent methyltransferase